MVEPFITTLKNRLPDVPLKSEVLETRASRLELAARLEAVLSEEKNKKESESTSRKEPESPSAGQLSQKGSGEATKMQEEAPPPSHEKSVPAMSRSLLIISTLTMAALLGLFLKRRSSAD